MPSTLQTFSRRLSKVITSILFGAMALGALLILVFGPRPRDTLPKDAVIVDFWAGWSGSEEAALQEIVDRFNATVGKEKGIYVRQLSLSNVNQKTLVATAAGVPPDIAGLYANSLAQYAALDALEPLDQMAAERGITSATYKKVFWDAAHYDGKLYGIVSTGYSIALYMNATMLEENAPALQAAGLDPKLGPRSIAELDRFAEILDRRDSAGRLEVAGYLPLEPGWWPNAFGYWFGGQWWDEKGKRFQFTDPSVVRAYDWVDSYSRRLGGASVNEFKSGFGNFDSPQNAFLSGSVAMVNHGAYLSAFINNQKPSMNGHYVVVPFPSEDPARLPNVTYCDADVFVIPRGAKHKREAAEFLAYFASQPQMERMATLHCKISPLAQVSEAFYNAHPNPFIRVFDEIAASPNAVGVPGVPILPEVTSETNAFVQRLVLGQTDAPEGLAAMQVVLQKKYDTFIEQQRQRHEKQGKP